MVFNWKLQHNLLLPLCNITTMSNKRPFQNNNNAEVNSKKSKQDFNNFKAPTRIGKDVNKLVNCVIKSDILGY